ncbi:MAG: hypothetical protein ACREOO_09565 [bacterium]
MLFIIDASSLIVLHRLDWFDLLEMEEDTVICPFGVMQEVKKDKKLLKAMRDVGVAVAEVKAPISFTQISAIDAQVIAIAIQLNGSILSEDILLGKKAKKLGLSVFNVTALLVLRYQQGHINKTELLMRLTTLVRTKVLSRYAFQRLMESLQ